MLIKCCVKLILLGGFRQKQDRQLSRGDIKKEIEDEGGEEGGSEVVLEKKLVMGSHILVSSRAKLLRFSRAQFVLPAQLGDQRQSERGKKRKTGTIKMTYWNHCQSFDCNSTVRI